MSEIQGPGGSGPGDVQREFVSEAEEILERLGSDLEDLADQRASGGEPSPDLVNRLFRSAHTLKGLAGSVGLDAMGELAHRMEDVLDGLRLGRITIDSPAVPLIHEAVSLFGTLLRELSDATEEAEPGAVSALCARIRESLVAPAAADGETDALLRLDLERGMLNALTEYEEHRLRESLRRGRRILRVEASFDLTDFEQGLATLTGGVSEVGELLSTLPSAGSEGSELEIRFVLLVASELDAPALAARLGIEPGQVREVSGGARVASASAALPAPAAPTAPARAATPPPVAATPPSEPLGDAGGGGRGAPPEDVESLRSISATVRVDIRKLDELMNLVGELAIQRGQLAAIIARLLAEASTARIGSELQKVLKRLERKLHDLQSGVLEVRMVPLQQVFEKLSRASRRLQRDLGKRVRLELRGAETELDKLIVEELIDPLLHLVRNAFDHAIESPEERAAAGKPVEGTIRIEASQRGNHVAIEISDDGRGIDPARVRARAESAGLVAAADVLSQREVLDLVFAPGLSTRTEVTETSGRGVGMDVVRANVTALGGRVELDSHLGRGTRVTLTLPITLAIIQTLLVRIGDQRFAIPLSSVLETLRLDGSHVQHSQDRELLNLRGEPLPLKDLAQELGLAADRAKRAFVVVVGLGEARVGVLVDKLEGQQDAVVKPIQGPVTHVRGVTGATEFGDHGAVLVLDVTALVEDPVRRREAA
ncbi:MAG TPA: chemotaxis protein CheA [Myxococcota bacterium]|nr:chemotaxis protein CheA [Myxococcota bacterium]